VKNKNVQIFSIIFLAFALIEITAAGLQLPNVYLIVKPLLMPALMLLLVFYKTSALNKNWLLAGLFFSFLGDVFLLYEYKNSLFFIVGLASFLITHVCYISFFLKIRSAQTSLLRQQPWLGALVAAYGCSLVMLLYPYLGVLKFPVIIYATVICCMLICSIHIFYKTGRPANVYFVAGALCFVISDSLLAINKFVSPFALAGVFIMATYCVAQFCIVKGFTKI
jgi:uncharacterized membrane protein YhhN